MPLIVSGKAVGSKRPVFEDWSVPLPPNDPSDGSNRTLRDLIAHIVRAEVEAYEGRREARRLDRVMSAAQIERGHTAGKVAPEGRESRPAPSVEDAIGNALLAFEDGLYVVAIDGEQASDLDAQVYLRADSKITFIRLTFLAGA